MPSAVTPITSPAHLRTITSSNSYTIIDFYADWCGPCKVISPIFEQLAAQETKAGRLAFVKVDVDAQREVAGNYGISAMPTFLILKGSSVKETVRGANATALRTAVLSAAADAAKGPAKGGAGGATFTGAGRALGGEGVAAKPATGPAFTMPNVSAIASSPASYSQGSGLPQTIVRFVGLYLQTFFTFEPAATAETSPFRVQKAGGNGARVRTAG
ncbi:hypothetical protein LTR95_011448 [Oleoguttula sp. CCFEE 5521]